MSKYKTRKFVITTPDQPTVTIIDDGYSVQAEWPTGTGSSSIGIRRPPPKPGETVDAKFSLDGEFFYLPTYVHHGHEGAWMGVKEHDSQEACKAAAKKGMMEPQGVQITRQLTNRILYRELLPFSFWDVKAEPGYRQLPTKDEMVQDFLSVCYGYDMQAMGKFDAAIAFTGRNYAWILKKIGPAELADAEPEPVLLSD